MIYPKYKRDYCSWCGEMKFLLPISEDPAGVCGMCPEDKDRLDVVASNARIKNLEARR